MVPLSYFDPGRRPRCSKDLAQGRDFWLPVILATEQAVDDNFKDREGGERSLKVSFVGRDVRLIRAHGCRRSYSQGVVGCRLSAFGSLADYRKMPLSQEEIVFLHLVYCLSIKGIEVLTDPTRLLKIQWRRN